MLSADLPDDCNDANSIWSILTDKLLYCQSDTADSVGYFSYDSLKAKSAKQRFFDAALNNEPYSNKAYLDSCNIEYCNGKDLYRYQLYDAVPIPMKNPKTKTLNTAEATASKDVPTKKLFPQYVENKYEDLEVHTSYEFDPAKSICATYLWTENVGYCTIPVPVIVLYLSAIFVRYINSSKLHLQSVALRSQYSDHAPEAVTLQ